MCGLTNLSLNLSLKGPREQQTPCCQELGPIPLGHFLKLSSEPFWVSWGCIVHIGKRLRIKPGVEAELLVWPDDLPISSFERCYNSI